MGSTVVIDYGMGNTKSVLRGIEQVGGEAILSCDYEDIINAGRLILPGVGAFKDGMNELVKRGLVDMLGDYIQTGKPFLGICLGMQMLFDESDEHGVHKGLGYIPGRVVHIPQDGNNIRKIPHIGWSAISKPTPSLSWDMTILNSLEDKEYFYFVHSYMAVAESKDQVLAECEYENLKITAAVKKDNITGCQFHPEKSGPAGLAILDTFINRATL